MKELNRMTSIYKRKLYALMNNMGNHERRMQSVNGVGIVDENEKMKSTEEGLS